jgi:hypothetical protein
MDPYYAATASTMAKPPNDGMGCFINAVLVAIFGPNQPWLTSALTTPLVTDRGEIKALREAVTAYATDLRFQAYKGGAARPETIRKILRAFPKLAPRLTQEARSNASSSSSEFLEVLLDSLVPKNDHLVHSRQEKLEWNDDHATVAFDRYFRWVSRMTSASGPLSSTAEPAPTWTSLVMQDLAKRPASLTASSNQTSPYFSLGTSDFPEGTLVSLSTVTRFTTLSTLSRPIFDYYLDAKPYRVKGVSISNGSPPSGVTLDALLTVAKDLLPSLQTGLMSQKMISFIRHKVDSGSPLFQRVVEWLATALGIGQESTPRARARNEKEGDTKTVLIIGLMMEALLLMGKTAMAENLWEWGKQDFGDQDSWVLIHHLKDCLDRAGQGLSYVAPGRLTGTMVTEDTEPHWIFTNRTVLALSGSPNLPGTTGLVLSLTPSPRRFFAMVDHFNDFVGSPGGEKTKDRPLVLTVPLAHTESSGPRPTIPMRLVGVVEYMGTRTMTPSATQSPYQYQSQSSQAAGHYRAWFYAAPTPTDRKHQWFLYDDLVSGKGPQPVTNKELGQVLKGWSAYGVAFFYVPLDTKEVDFNDKLASAYQAGLTQRSVKSSSPVTMVSSLQTPSSPKGVDKKRLQEFLAASPKALHLLKGALSSDSQDLSSALPILFPLVDEGSHPAWDLDGPTANLLSASPRFREVQDHGFKAVLSYWGLRRGPSALQVKDGPRFERHFVHAKDGYRGVARVLASLSLMGRHKDQSLLAYIVAQDLLANALPEVRSKAEFLRSFL